MITTPGKNLGGDAGSDAISIETSFWLKVFPSSFSRMIYLLHFDLEEFIIQATKNTTCTGAPLIGWAIGTKTQIEKCISTASAASAFSLKPPFIDRVSYLVTKIGSYSALIVLI